MIKKYKKLFLIALFSFFISFSTINVYAVEMSLEELGNEVLDRAEVKGETYDYLYIVGQHAFTSKHELTLEDLMLGARTIQLSEDAGRTDSDSIYNEMTTYTLNAHVNDDFEIDGYEVGVNFTGTSEEPTTFELQYIDGEKIGEATSIVDHITDSIDYVSNKITNKYINELSLNNIYDKASLLDKENSTTSDYLYVVGQYAFSSNHTLTIEDLMLGATTIEINSSDEETVDNMATYTLNAHVNDDFEIDGFEIGENFTGKSTNDFTAYNLHFIDYNDIVNLKGIAFFDENNLVTFVEAGEDGKVANFPNAPIKENSVFVGWFDNNGNEYTTATEVEGIITVYAKYTEKVDVFELVSNNSDSESNVFAILPVVDTHVKPETKYFTYITNNDSTYDDAKVGITNIVKSLIETKEIKEFAIFYGDNLYVFDETTLSGSELTSTLDDAKIQVIVLDIVKDIKSELAIDEDKDLTGADLEGEVITIAVKLDEKNYVSTNDKVIESFDIEFALNDGAFVTNEEQLRAAIASDSITNIYIMNDFSVENTVAIGTDKYIYGLNHTISAKENTFNIFELKDTTDSYNRVEVENLSVTGGAFAFKVSDDSQLVVSGKLDLTGNKDGAVKVTSTGTVLDYDKNIKYDDEKYSKPAVVAEGTDYDVQIIDVAEETIGNVTNYYVTALPNQIYTVTYKVFDDETSSKFIPNETLVKPEDPSVENYEFDGWYLNDVKFTFEETPASNITLVAKMNPNENLRGKISYVDGFSVEPIIKDNTVTFADGEIKYYEGDAVKPAANRVGVIITAPSALDKATYEAAKVKVYYTKAGVRTEYYSGTFNDAKNAEDAENVFGVWPAVTNDFEKVEIEVKWSKYLSDTFTIVIDESASLQPAPSSIEYIGGFSAAPTVVDNTLTFANGEVTYYESNNANRVGVIIKAPTNMTKADYQAAKVTVNYTRDGESAKYFEGTFVEAQNAEDAENVFGVWPAVTADLEKAEIIVEWSDSRKDTYNLVFGENITLQPASSTIEYLDGFSVEPTIEDNTITFANGEVTYYDGDANKAAANRVGVLVTAPVNMDKAAYENANVQVYYTKGGNTTKYFEGTFTEAQNAEDAENTFGVWPAVTNDMEKVQIIVKWSETKTDTYTLVFGENVSLVPAPSSIEYIGGFSVAPTVVDNTLTFANGEVTYYDGDANKAAANRVGILVKAPVNMAAADYKTAEVKVYYTKGGVREEYFSGTFTEAQNAEDAKNVFGVWPAVTADLELVEIEVKWSDDKTDTFKMVFGENVTLETAN